VERVVFAESWQPVFAGFGLKSFDDFFYFSGGKKINKNKKRDVSILTFGDEPNRKVFFLKRFRYPHFKDMFFAWRNFGWLCSQARCEWENARFLLDNGIGTYKPVCYGEQIRFGLERKSFFITENVQGQCLTDFVRQKWHHLKTEQKEKIIVSLAKFIRKVHDVGLNLPDLYLWHIFISETEHSEGGNEYEFAVIDLHRMTLNVTNKKRQIRNLGRLDHSMVDKYFDKAIRRLLVKSYAGDNWPGGTAKLTGLVKKYSDAVSSKRSPKPY